MKDFSNVSLKKVENKVTKPSKRVKGKRPTKLSLLKGIAFYTKDGNFNIKVVDEVTKRSSYYPIDYYNLKQLYEISDYKYSTPDNDKHETWKLFKREPHVPNRFDIIFKYWSVLKQGLIVYGKIFHNQFIILKVKELALEEPLFAGKEGSPFEVKLYENYNK